MSHAATLPSPAAAPRSANASPGWALVLAAVASTVAVALDQGAGGHNPQEILRNIGQLQSLKGLVHGVAIAATCLYAFAHASLAQRLGPRRPAVTAGLVAYLLGCVALLGATLLDGFVTPQVALDGAAATAPERLRFAYDLVHYLGIVLTDLAKLGWVLQAAGVLLWSSVLVQGTGRSRWVGAIGLLSSALMLVAVIGSPLSMSMAPILAVLVSQLLWNVTAGAWLIRSPDTAPRC